MLKKKLFLSKLAVVAMLSVSGSAQAALFHFTGSINNHNDVLQFGFSVLNDATNVRVWTDSFQNGVNFDPITALWTGAGTLIAENDDNPNINPSTQTYWDSGFALPSLAAGDYIFSVASFSNFANGTTLADGFSFDQQNPIPIQQWPLAGGGGIGTQGNWSVWLDGVDSATPPSTVPEPTTLALLGMGLAGLGFKRRRRVS